MDKLVSEARKRNLKFEVFSIREETRSLSFEQSELQDISHKIIEGAGVRVIHENRLGFSSSNNIHNPEVIDYAINSAKYGKEALFSFPELPEHSESLGELQSEIEFEEIFPIIKEVVKYLETKYSGKVNLSVTQIASTRKLANYRSEKLVQRHANFFDFSLSLFSITSSGFLFTFNWTWKKSKLEAKDLWDTVGKMERTLINYEKVVRVPSGKYKVVFGPPSLLVTLGMAVSSGVNGFYLSRRMSPLLGKMNEKILDDKINIFDDPLMDTPGKKKYDDEGLPVSKRAIIENGVLKNFILNLDSAQELNMSPSGNGIRGSYTSQPLPGFHTLHLLEGNRSLDEIVAELDNTILFLFPIGGGQSNILMGDYSLNVGLGYYIEKGEIIGRVKDTMISGNVYSDFNRILEISKDSELFPGVGSTFAKLPFVVLEGISVTSK
jgi:PmbA protein